MGDEVSLVLSKSPSRHKPLRRSLSAQPEENTQSSSPYSTRKKASLPGRSLTQYFSRPNSTARAGSEECQVYQRRSSATANSNSMQLVPVLEEEPKPSRTSSFPNPQFEPTPGLRVFADYQQTIAYNFGNDRNHHSGTMEVGNEQLGTGVDKDNKRLSSRHPRKKQKVSDATSEKSSKTDNSRSWRLLKKFCKVVIFLLILVFISILAVIGLSTLFVYQEALCEEKKNSLLPLNKLQNVLFENVIGQDVAINIVMNALKMFAIKRPDIPLILWLVGRTGGGKTLTINIIKNILSNSTHMEVVMPSFLPNDVEGLQKESDSLFHSLDSCALNMVVVDGWDQENNIPLTILDNLLTNIQIHRDKGFNKGRVIFVLSGTRGSMEVSDHYLDQLSKGKLREEFTPEDFAGLSAVVSEAATLNRITKHYKLVPFLPIDVPSVKLCIMKELERLNRTDVTLNKEGLRKITKDVLSHLMFAPSSSPVYSVSGCKRIHSLLTIHLADLRYAP